MTLLPYVVIFTALRALGLMWALHILHAHVAAVPALGFADSFFLVLASVLLTLHYEVKTK